MKGSTSMTEDNFRDVVARDLEPRSRASRVLVADDDDDMRLLVCRALRKDGYDVVEAIDGLAMMNWIEHGYRFPLQLPDLIVMDVLMPGYSGLGVLTALRRARWFTPVILMTAFPHESVVTHAKGLGVTAVFTKPFDINDLRTAALNASLVGARANGLSPASARKGEPI